MSDNDEIADLLRQAAALLVDQGANPFRANACRRAADTIASLAGSVRAIFAKDGTNGLDALPGIGEGIASAIAEILVAGHWTRLATVPGIGPLRASAIAAAVTSLLNQRRISRRPGAVAHGRNADRTWAIESWAKRAIACAAGADMRTAKKGTTGCRSKRRSTI